LAKPPEAILAICLGQRRPLGIRQYGALPVRGTGGRSGTRPPLRPRQSRGFPGAMGGRVWRMAGEPSAFPSPKLPKRSNAPWEWASELIGVGEGCRLVVTGMAEAVGLLGFVGTHAGVFDAEFGKAAERIERIIRESEGAALVPGGSVEDLAEPAARQCARHGTRARPCFARPGTESNRFPAACACRRSAQHSSDGAGDAMVRPPRSRSGVVPGGGPAGSRGDGMGAALPALPRCQIPREPTSGPAESRALLLLQHRLRTKFQPQRRADFPSRALDSPSPGRGEVPAGAGLRAAHQVSGRGGGAVGQEL
jgi:hypothetical protein